MAYIQFINLNPGSIPEPPVLNLATDKPDIYTNCYVHGNTNTNYTRLITNPVINNDKTLFIYNANQANTGYKGGMGSTSAMIGGMENTYGFLTGFLDKPDNYNGPDKPGFPSLDKFSRFKKYIDGVSIELTSGSTITGNTTKELIDSLFTDLIKTINAKKYTRIVLPVDNTGNLGNQVFEIGKDVKKYIIDCFSQIQPHATWKPVQTLLTNTQLSDADKAREAVLNKELTKQMSEFANYVAEKREAKQTDAQAHQAKHSNSKESKKSKDYRPPTAKVINIGFAFDGVLHASVTPLICSAGKCSRQPINKEKQISMNITTPADVIPVQDAINYVENKYGPGVYNGYVISSNPNVISNFEALYIENGHLTVDVVSVIYAGDNKLNTIRKLKLEEYYDDSNMHLYNILDASDKKDLPRVIIKVFPEWRYNIYDSPEYNTDPTKFIAVTNNQYLVEIKKPAQHIRVFTYNINYKITTNPDKHKDHIQSIRAIINHVATDPAHKADFICLQESTMSGTKLGADMSGYAELVNTTHFTGPNIETQYTYYDKTKYNSTAVLFGNLDGQTPPNDNSIYPSRPFTLVCLENSTTRYRIILINVHFPHTNKSNTDINKDIEYFINNAKFRQKNIINEYIAYKTRIIMAGDFNRVIAGNPGKLLNHENSHYGLALFGSLAKDSNPVILYNIEATEGHFEKKEHQTCCDIDSKLKSATYDKHVDNVLDSWGLQYKYEYPDTDYNIKDLTEYASDHRPVMVTLLDAMLVQ